MQYISHTFRPGETINAVLRLKNQHSLTRAELAKLVNVFNDLNNSKLPRPGATFKIPLVSTSKESLEGARVGKAVNPPPPQGHS